MGNKNKTYIIAFLVVLVIAGVYWAYKYSRTQISNVKPPVKQIGLFNAGYTSDASFTFSFPIIGRMDFDASKESLPDLVYSPNSRLQSFTVTYTNGKKGSNVSFSTTGSMDELMSFFSNQKAHLVKKYNNIKQGFVELSQGTTLVRALVTQTTQPEIRKITIQSVIQ